MFEFDGKSYHDSKADMVRDDQILSENPQVQSITRVDASTYIHYYDECRGKLYELIPECFDIDVGRIQPGGSYYLCGNMYKHQDQWFEYNGTHYARKLVDCDENKSELEYRESGDYPSSLRMYKLTIHHKKNHEG